MLVGDTPRTVDEAELAGWTGLELSCPGCRMLTYIKWPKLRRRSGYRKLTEIRDRLVCERCGRKPELVRLHRMVTPPGGTPTSERMDF